MTAAPRYKSDHSAEQRDCALYYIDTLDPATGYTTVRRNAYIGETARATFTRFLEHLYEQPFGDTIVGKPRVDPRVFRSKDEVWAAEQAAIEQFRPLYNYEHNLDNPDRIPIPEARRQREERDRARGVEPPTWDARRSRQPGRRPVRRRSWRWVTSRPARFVGAWLALFGAAMWAATRLPDLPVRWRLLGAAVAASVPVGTVWWLGLSRRSQRRLVRTGVAVLATAAVMYLLILAGVQHLSAAPASVGR